MVSWRNFVERDASFEPAEMPQEAGWLRSRFMGQRYPRDGIVACGRRSCPVCGAKVGITEAESEWKNAWAALW
jgi:hypothetical protein